LSTEGKQRSGTPSQVTVPENVDAINPITLYGRRMSAKKTAGNLSK
jgi:hypothetical protein